ncbi:MAG: DMT family transporter [Cellulophaga sp.]
MSKIKGVVFIVAGAASYGVLASFVKLANIKGFETSVLTFFQFLFGYLVLSGIAYFTKKTKVPGIISRTSKLKLILYGSSLGLTSCLYYLSIQYVPVSIAIILLMQTIWMGSILEIFIEKTKPDRLKIIGSLVVLLGTVLAVNAFNNFYSLHYKGLIYGILASISYTIALMASNKIALDLPNIIRSKYLVLGGFIATVLFWNVDILANIEFQNPMLIFFGLFLALFGTIMPPVLFNKGFPIIGIGIGSILSAIEIPISIFTAKIILKEEVQTIQWLGVFIILISVAIINFKHISKQPWGNN